MVLGQRTLPYCVFNSLLPHCLFNSLLPHTNFPADSIERSADLMEPVFQVRVMAASQSADGDLVLPRQLQAFHLMEPVFQVQVMAASQSADGHLILP